MASILWGARQSQGCVETETVSMNCVIISAQNCVILGTIDRSCPWCAKSELSTWISIVRGKQCFLLQLA